MKADYDELSDRGRAQASHLGEHLVAHDITFDAVFCGPARRHRDTEALAGAQVRAASRPWPEAQPVPQLDEHDAFGLVKGAVASCGDDPTIAAAQRAMLEATSPAARSGTFQRLFEVIMARWLREELVLEGIETWPQFRARITEGLQRVLDAAGSGCRAVAFSSVGPLAVLLQRALGTDDASSFTTAWRLRNCSLTTFVFDGRGRFTLDAFNAVPHLPDPRTWTFR